MACTGQSNMEMPLKGFAGCCIMNGVDDIIVSAENRGVRMFTVPKHQTYERKPTAKVAGTFFHRNRTRFQCDGLLFCHFVEPCPPDSGRHHP